MSLPKSLAQRKAAALMNQLMFAMSANAMEQRGKKERAEVTPLDCWRFPPF